MIFFTKLNLISSNIKISLGTNLVLCSCTGFTHVTYFPSDKFANHNSYCIIPFSVYIKINKICLHHYSMGWWYFFQLRISSATTPLMPATSVTVTWRKKPLFLSMEQNVEVSNSWIEVCGLYLYVSVYAMLADQ